MGDLSGAALEAYYRNCQGKAQLLVDKQVMLI